MIDKPVHYNNLFYIKYFDADQNKIVLWDHLDGFDADYRNHVIDNIHKFQQGKLEEGKLNLHYHQILPSVTKIQYPNIAFDFDMEWQLQYNFMPLHQYKSTGCKNIKHFISCFNGSSHLSRQFITLAIKKAGWWNDLVCTKNFSFDYHLALKTIERLKGTHSKEKILEYFQANKAFGAKIVSQNYIHGNYEILYNGFKTLEPALHSSFIHIVTEAVGTSSVPFITEKFLKPIITKSLFVTYGQPHWHYVLEKYYGFKPFTIFDYAFDRQVNPIDRLIQLIDMIKKFENLSASDWSNLYEDQNDILEYNYDHYHSKNFVKHLKKMYNTHNSELLDNIITNTYNNRGE
tara:strand:- start:176 stop:1213 length:1038 start_codon:yes stop_codon:yes gene_type:complete